MFSGEYCEVLYEHLRTAAFALLIIKKLLQQEVLDIYPSSLLTQKDNIGWFLRGNFVDLLRAYSLQIISRNHPQMFLLVNLQKNKSLSREIYITLRAICSVVGPLLNVYFNGMKINRWLHLSSCLLGIPLYRDVFRKRTDQENFLLQQQVTELCQLFGGL